MKNKNELGDAVQSDGPGQSGVPSSLRSDPLSAALNVPIAPTHGPFHGTAWSDDLNAKYNEGYVNASAPPHNPQGLRIIVAGSRTCNDYPLVKKELDFLFRKGDMPSAILSGGAAGIDRMGEIWAKENNVPVEIYPADWGKHGKAAGPIRNREMARKANGLVAFWNGESRGTKNMIEEAGKRGLAVWIEELSCDNDRNGPKGSG